MTRKRRRLYLLGLMFAALGVATALVLSAFRDSIVFFYSPSEIVEKRIPPDRPMRIGGLVEVGSLQRAQGSLEIRFRVTDLNHAVPVIYAGVLPDLFREGQGVVAQGKLDSEGVFRASEVLAKHDENYMPPEVADALKKSGHWQDKAGTKR
ncbi:MAG TPA: cytochrome c maturation protein CcmE [Alphaproteobacteria bacterium]|nr:cytochrome c maturation protein CcmE [Alphaproteobacteria bacterium]